MVSREASCKSRHHRRISPSSIEWSFNSVPTPCRVSNVIQSQARFTLKLIRCELYKYNNEERRREHIKWCQKLVELGGNIVDVVYMDEVDFILHFTC